MKMKPIFVFDAYKTLADCPDWDRIKETDPNVMELAKKWYADRKTWNDAFLAKFDEYCAQGKIISHEIPGTRKVLEQLVGQGALCVYSSATEDSLPAMLEQSGLIDLFPDRRLVIPASRIGNMPKTYPEAFRLLNEYLKREGFEITTYTDDGADIIEAAIKSQAPIQRIYHLDRKAKGLAGPEQKDGYVRIASLDQMLELRR